jgi:hypothetical protein
MNTSGILRLLSLSLAKWCYRAIAVTGNYVASVIMRSISRSSFALDAGAFSRENRKLMGCDPMSFLFLLDENDRAVTRFVGDAGSLSDVQQ